MSRALPIPGFVMDEIDFSPRFPLNIRRNVCSFRVNAILITRAVCCFHPDQLQQGEPMPQLRHANITVKNLFFVVMLLTVTAQCGIADEKSDAAKRRLNFMRQAVQRFEVDITSKPDAVILPQKELILRWSNPTTTVKDGGLGVFCQDGRPVVYVELQLHGGKGMIHEFARLTKDPVRVRRPDRNLTIWEPGEDSWSDFQPFPDSGKPVKSATLRLTQMRQLAKRFRLVDHFGNNEKELQVQELRLMPSPVYRYGDTADVIDGAVFVFAQGTNPEAILTLETYRDGDSTAFRYVFTPSTIYQVQAFLGDELVWDKPRYMRYGTQKGPYYAYPYIRHPDDDDLKGAFPK